MEPNRLKEQPGRVEIGAAIRAAAALIAGLSTPVVLIVLGLNLTEQLVPDVGVLRSLPTLFLSVGASVLLVAALVAPKPRGLRPRGLRPVVILAFKRLPAAIGVELVTLGVFLVVFLVVGLVILGAGRELPVSSVRGGIPPTLFIGMVAVSTALVARWICALPFVIVRSHGPIAALRASWSATRARGSPAWSCCCRQPSSGI